MNRHQWPQHPLLCVNTSTAISNLYNLFCNHILNNNLAAEFQPITNIKDRRAQLWATKLAYYCLYGQLVLRGFHFAASADLEGESALEASLSVNPLIVMVVKQFSFLNAPLLLSISFASLWVVYLDYVFTYNMDADLLDTLYQMIVDNGHHFRALNGRQLGGWPSRPTAVSPIWSWLRLPVAYAALGKRIWKQTETACSPFSADNEKNGTSVLGFKSNTTTTLQLYPQPKLAIFSTLLRSRLYVYSNIFEVLVVFSNVFILSKYL